jgi:hypothetical protein
MPRAWEVDLCESDEQKQKILCGNAGNLRPKRPKDYRTEAGRDSETRTEVRNTTTEVRSNGDHEPLKPTISAMSRPMGGELTATLTSRVLRLLS